MKDSNGVEPIAIPRPPAPPGWLKDPRAATGALRVRRRGTDKWGEFVEWCSRRGLDSMPAAASSVAAYLIDRAAELDEFGRMAHGHGRLGSWAKTIADRHRDEGFDLRYSAPEISAVLSRYRLAQRRVEESSSTSVAARLGRALGKLPPGAITDRDRAALLVVLVGGVDVGDLANLRVRDLHHVPGDGIWITLPCGEVAWLASIDAPGLCAPCAVLHWLRVSLGELVEPASDNGHEVVGIHLCGIAVQLSRHSGAAEPLFPRLTDPDASPEGFLDREALEGIVFSRLAAMRLSLNEGTGVRDELTIARVVNEFWPVGQRRSTVQIQQSESPGRRTADDYKTSAGHPHQE